MQNKYTKLLRQASAALRTDPELAKDLLERALEVSTPAPAVLHKAWSVLVGNQLAWSKGEVHRDQIPMLHDAARTFYANDHFDEAVMALALCAQLAAVVGDITSALRHSVHGFRELRASPDCRLMASRAIIWMFPDGESELADRLLTQVRELADLAQPCTGKALVSSYLAFREFKVILGRAGLPTDSLPYPPAASLTPDQARQAVLQLIGPLEAQLSAMRACLPAEPVPMLFLAALHGFVHGSAICTRLAAEVAQKCGSSAEPYIHSVIGVAHLRHGETALAVKHLQQALDAYGRRGRAEEGRPWVFYLSLALRAEGRYQESLEALDRFLASGQKLQPWVTTAKALRMLEEEAEVGSTLPLPPAYLLDSRPPYVNLALQWMRSRLHQAIRVPDIVAATSISRRTLELGFRNFRNRSIAEELRWMRMQRALELLMSADAQLHEVRRQVGYQSASSFSRDFRKVFGVTPSRSSILHLSKSD